MDHHPRRAAGCRQGHSPIGSIGIDQIFGSQRFGYHARNTVERCERRLADQPALSLDRDRKQIGQRCGFDRVFRSNPDNVDGAHLSQMFRSTRRRNDRGNAYAIALFNVRDGMLRPHEHQRRGDAPMRQMTERQRRSPIPRIPVIAGKGRRGRPNPHVMVHHLMFPPACSTLA